MVQLDIPMPKTCYECPCHDGENNSCQVTGKYYYDEILRSCPLIELPSAQPEQQWIPVTEIMPDEHDRVLILTDDGTIFIGDHNEYWEDDYEIDIYDVIAWMPLPQKMSTTSGTYKLITKK